MLNLDLFDAPAVHFPLQFTCASPTEHVVEDTFGDAVALSKLCNEIPCTLAMTVKRSGDCPVASNKCERCGFCQVSPDFGALCTVLTCKRLHMFLKTMTGQRSFVDPDFQGGGLNQGGANSYLDKPVECNTHPLHKTWLRTLNVLPYPVRDWQPAYKRTAEIAAQGSSGGNFGDRASFQSLRHDFCA